VRQKTIPQGTHDQIWNIARVIRMVRINGKIASGWTKIEVAPGGGEASSLLLRLMWMVGEGRAIFFRAAA